MPIYEYRCQSCSRKFSVFFRSFSETSDPSCSHCGSESATRVISQVAVIKSPNEFMGHLPSWETMSDFDEDDPRSVAEMMRRLKDDSGQDIGPQGEEMLAMLDAGEMMSDMGDSGDDFGF